MSLPTVWAPRAHHAAGGKYVNPFRSDLTRVPVAMCDAEEHALPCLFRPPCTCRAQSCCACENGCGPDSLIVFLFLFSPFFFCIAVRVWLAPYDDTNPAPLLIKHKHEPKPFRASDGSEQRAAPPLSFYLFCFALLGACGSAELACPPGPPATTWSHTFPSSRTVVLLGRDAP